MWESYQFDIVEIDWIFYIHIVVYALQLVWLFYALFAVHWWTSQSKLHPHLYPPILPCYMYITYFFGLCGVIGWVILRTLPTLDTYSIIPIAVSVLLFCIALDGGLRAGGRYTQLIEPGGSHGHMWGVKVVVYNGLSLMVTWVHALTMYSMASLLYDRGIISRHIAEYIAVGIMMAFLALWWTVDVFLTNRVSIGIVTPYLLTTTLFTMSLIKNIHKKNMHFTIGAAFVGLSSLLLLLKLCAMRQWECTKPAANDMYVLNKNKDIKKRPPSVTKKNPALLDPPPDYKGTGGGIQGMTGLPPFMKTTLPDELTIRNEILRSPPEDKACAVTSIRPAHSMDLPTRYTQSPISDSTKVEWINFSGSSTLPRQTGLPQHPARPSSEPPKDNGNCTLRFVQCSSTLPRMPPKKGKSTGGGEPLHVMRF